MHLNIGYEPNQFKLLVQNLEIKDYATMNNGCIISATRIRVNMYNVNDLLAQMLDDYGEKELIKRIKALK